MKRQTIPLDELVEDSHSQLAALRAVADAARELIKLGASFKGGALRGVMVGALDPLRKLDEAVFALDALEAAEQVQGETGHEPVEEHVEHYVEYKFLWMGRLDEARDLLEELADVGWEVVCSCLSGRYLLLRRKLEKV